MVCGIILCSIYPVVDLKNNSIFENWCGIAFLVTGFIVLKGDRRITMN